MSQRRVGHVARVAGVLAGGAGPPTTELVSLLEGDEVLRVIDDAAVAAWVLGSVDRDDRLLGLQPVEYCPVFRLAKDAGVRALAVVEVAVGRQEVAHFSLVRRVCAHGRVSARLADLAAGRQPARVAALPHTVSLLRLLLVNLLQDLRLLDAAAAAEASTIVRVVRRVVTDDVGRVRLTVLTKPQLRLAFRDLFPQV